MDSSHQSSTAGLSRTTNPLGKIMRSEWYKIPTNNLQLIKETSTLILPSNVILKLYRY